MKSYHYSELTGPLIFVDLQAKSHISLCLESDISNATIYYTRLRETSMGDIEDVPFLPERQSKQLVQDLHSLVHEGRGIQYEIVTKLDSTEYIIGYKINSSDEP